MRVAIGRWIPLRPLAGALLVMLALSLGFGVEARTPENISPALVVLSLGVGAVLTTMVVATRPESGFARRIVEGIILGGISGASLVVGSYLAYAVGLGSYADQGDWSGEAGRSMTGFLVFFSATGALCGGCCGLISLVFRHGQEPHAGQGGRSHA